MSQKTLILGGAKSGKSAFAESLCNARTGPKIYLATGQAFDDEMVTRIKAHQATRDYTWQTVEAPLDIVAALEKHDHTGTVILIDCLTLWISNLMLAESSVKEAVTNLIAALEISKADIFIVSNEVGQGIVPDNKLARQFRDRAGSAHQRLAALCNQVYFVTAGLPQKLKDEK